jgi:hypothetical protein
MIQIQPTHLLDNFGLYSGGRQRVGVAQSFSHVRTKALNDTYTQTDRRWMFNTMLQSVRNFIITLFNLSSNAPAA